MKTNRKKTMKWIAVALSLLLIGTAFGLASAEGLSAMLLEASTAEQLESPFKAVYQQASPSVVGIELTTQATARNGRISSQASFVGSGVVVAEGGYVVTNYHVVNTESSSTSSYYEYFYGNGSQEQIAQNISVVYEGERYPAEYIAGDEDTDVAVLRAEGLPAPAAKIGNSEALSVGDWALVIGNPLGEEFANTLTMGVISGLDRDMTTTDRRGDVSGTKMIQTNAAINSGNSGGGLFNIRGELVGITSMKLSNNGYYGAASIEGFGFAIPMSVVSEIADQLMTHGTVKNMQAGIGVVVQAITGGSEEPTAETLPNSLWVRDLTEGAPAEMAGIQVNDLITEADGQRVLAAADLQKIIRGHEEGESVSITVYRIPDITRIRVDEDYPEGEFITFDVPVQMMEMED
ncbi:MAG: trypsin-like peptidase domain-containing protein [Oscillospiraceae bacterium]|jgi:serine protease Do|nr:trypsin-like peptidase domain-containing protein [Oscillospiraceae bacterium]